MRERSAEVPRWERSPIDLELRARFPDTESLIFIPELMSRARAAGVAPTTFRDALGGGGYDLSLGTGMTPPPGYVSLGSQRAHLVFDIYAPSKVPDSGDNTMVVVGRLEGRLERDSLHVEFVLLPTPDSSFIVPQLLPALARRAQHLELKDVQLKLPASTEVLDVPTELGSMSYLDFMNEEIVVEPPHPLPESARSLDQALRSTGFDVESSGVDCGGRSLWWLTIDERAVCVCLDPDTDVDSDRLADSIDAARILMESTPKLVLNEIRIGTDNEPRFERGSLVAIAHSDSARIVIRPDVFAASNESKTTLVKRAGLDSIEVDMPTINAIDIAVHEIAHIATYQASHVDPERCVELQRYVDERLSLPDPPWRVNNQGHLVAKPKTRRVVAALISDYATHNPRELEAEMASHAELHPQPSASVAYWWHQTRMLLGASPERTPALSELIGFRPTPF